METILDTEKTMDTILKCILNGTVDLNRLLVFFCEGEENAYNLSLDLTVCLSDLIDSKQIEKHRYKRNNEMYFQQGVKFPKKYLKMDLNPVRDRNEDWVKICYHDYCVLKSPKFIL